MTRLFVGIVILLYAADQSFNGLDICGWLMFWWGFIAMCFPQYYEKKKSIVQRLFPGL